MKFVQRLVFFLILGSTCVQFCRGDLENDLTISTEENASSSESKEDSIDSLLRNFAVKPNYELTSPYQVLPGSYDQAQSSFYTGNSPYNARQIYTKYLASGAFHYHSPACVKLYSQYPKITPQDIEAAFRYGDGQIRVKYPEYLNQSHYTSTSHKEVEGHLLELVAEYFAIYKCFSKYQLATYLPAIMIDQKYKTLNRFGDISCTAFYNENYKCAAHFLSKYRTIDGSCNNRFHPYWGRSNICHVRLLPPDYSDGIQAFRMSISGKPLPNPRLISNFVSINKDLKSYYTSLILGWGQFINHDISNTEGHKSNPLNKVDCCIKPDSKCTSIKIDDTKDFFLAKFNTKCINFMRSSPCPLCKLGPREQLNAQTSFLDGSQVYGATVQESAKLRLFQNGFLLAVSNKLGHQILPVNNAAKPCMPLKKGLKCFVAGDNRVNQHPILLTMHTLLMRNHNQHAIRLKVVNPSWNDEKLFQEARRLSIAEIQHITYNEYLPVILGSLLSHYYSLTPLDRGYTNYEPLTDPTSWNEFATAASRYGHSQIKDNYKTVSSNYINSSIFLLKDNFFEPGFAWDGLIEDIIRGITSDPANTVDPFYSFTAKHFIMRPKTKNFGIDLIATNILRGRDHGIPGYINYLKACFNYEAKTWKDLEKFIPSETLEKFKLIYKSIEDIDLYIAGVSEKHFVDGNLGPTFSCLVGIQFYHLKFGDRYYYEHGGQSGSFTLAQLDNIRRSASLARLLCRNGVLLQKIQPKPLYLPSRFNQPISCASYPEIDYNLWKE